MIDEIKIQKLPYNLYDFKMVMGNDTYSTYLFNGDKIVFEKTEKGLEMTATRNNEPFSFIIENQLHKKPSEYIDGVVGKSFTEAEIMDRIKNIEHENYNNFSYQSEQSEQNNS